MLKKQVIDGLSYAWLISETIVWRASLDIEELCLFYSKNRSEFRMYSIKKSISSIYCIINLLYAEDLLKLSTYSRHIKIFSALFSSLVYISQAKC